MRKFTISKIFLLNKETGEAERLLFQLLHEMGYRIVTAFHWEMVGPLVLGIYRIKWIPNRYLDVEIISKEKSKTEIKLYLSYYLNRKRNRDRIHAIFQKELDIISDILMSDKKGIEHLKDIEIKSLKEESNVFRNVILISSVIIAFIGVYALTNSLESKYVFWALMTLFLVQVLVIFWFRNQDIRQNK